MAIKDWFRRTTWTCDDQQDFFARLSRARRQNRPQYMCIQAVHLLETQIRGNIQAALDLLNLCLEECPPNAAELENIHNIRARCLDRLGQVDASMDAYRVALQARQSAPRIRTDAPLDFAFLIVREHRKDLYAEATVALHEHVKTFDLLFPDAQYRYFAASAIILQELRETERAKECATKALQAASRTVSGLSHHPHVGLVKSRDKGVESSLRRILGPGLPWRLSSNR